MTQPNLENPRPKNIDDLADRIAVAKRAAARLSAELAHNASKLSAALSAPLPGEANARGDRDTFA